MKKTLIISAFCFLLSAFCALAQNRYQLTPVFTDQALTALSTNALFTNVTITASPVVLSGGQGGKLSWGTTLTNGIAGTNVVWSLVFAQDKNGPYVNPQLVTNKFLGIGLGTNEVQIITVPEQMRWLKVTNAAFAMTNNGTATLKIGQFWE